MKLSAKGVQAARYRGKAGKDKWSEGHRAKVQLRVDKHLSKSFLNTPISSVTKHDIAQLLERIQATGSHDVAHRMQSHLTGIFDRAFRAEAIPTNPVLLIERLTKPTQKRMEHVTDVGQFGNILYALDHYLGEQSIRNCLRILPLVFTRPSELREARWSEVNFEQKQLRFDASRMKSRQVHIVPLSDQVIEILKEQREYFGDGEFVFPSSRTNRPISSGTLNMGLRRLGFSKDIIVGHGHQCISIGCHVTSQISLRRTRELLFLRECNRPFFTP